MRMQFGKVHYPGYRDGSGHVVTACGLFGEETTRDAALVTCEECKQFCR